MSDNYFKIEATNYSNLKVLLDSPEEYYHQVVEGNRKAHSGTDLGSLVHCLLLEPHEFHNQFCVLEATTPSSKNQELFVDILTMVDMLDLKDPEVLAAAYSKCYKCSDKEALTKGVKLYEELEGYLFFKKNQNGRLAVSKEDFETATKVANIAKNHPSVKFHLLKNADEDIFFELPIVWESQFSKRALKSKVDLLVVDHKKKEARYYDYKTTRHSNLEKFRWAIKDLHYDMQLSFYEHAIAFYLKQKFGHTYKVASHIIAQKNSAPYQVLGVFRLHENDMMKGWEKWKTALEDLDWREEENHWRSTEEYTTNIQVYRDADTGVAHVFNEETF